MLNFIKKIFKKNDPVKDSNVQAAASIQNDIIHKAAAVYRKRQNFTGEKFEGGMNYDSAFENDRHSILLKSKKAYAESMQARGIVKRLVDTVINTGLSLESTPDSSILGISSDERKEVSNRIESSFNLWAKDKNCDVSKENNLGQIERILFRNLLIKGDYFAVLKFSTDENLINPLQIKVVNPDLVSTPFDPAQIQAAEDRGNTIIDGIEFNSDDQEIAYYIKSKQPGTFSNKWLRIPKFGAVSGRQVVIHGKTQDFGTEARGIPILANVAHELEKITDYSLLELMAAVANATVAAIVKPSENAPATNPMPSNTFIPPELANNLNVSTEDYESSYTNIGKNVMRNTGGLLVSSLNAGEEYQSFDTKRPNVNYGGFVDSVMEYLASALSMPNEVLKMKFGENFSASRASLKLFWQSLNVWREEFVSDFLTPVYSSWLLGEAGTGRIVLNGFENTITKAAWSSAKWIGIPSPSIDPFKEERAAKIRVEEGFTTREQEAQRRHQTSFDSNVERLAEENQKLADANKPLVENENGATAAVAA